MSGKRTGLVIGNNYPNSKIELKFAVADATKMKEILEDKDICYFDNVTLLTNIDSRDAQIEIEKILRNAGQDDLILIYFSGHGKKDFTNDLYLLFKDTNEESPLATSLTFDFINKCRKYPQALRASIIIILDCCYSAAAGMKDTDVAEKLSSYCSKGMVILTSTGSTGTPTAMEDAKLGHSVFTYYLIEGLEKGYADKSGEGKISIDELYKYAFEKTKEGYSQSPKKEGSLEGTVFIGKNPLKIKRKEYESKKRKLIEEFGDQLHPRILDESLKILKKNNETPSLMDKDEIKINNYLESLLNYHFSIENFSDVVQLLVKINISDGQHQLQEQERKRKEIEEQEKTLKEEEKKRKGIEEQEKTLKEQERILKEQERRLQEQEKTLQVQERKMKEIEEQERKLQEQERKRKEIEEQERKLQEQEKTLKEQEKTLKEQERILQEQERKKKEELERKLQEQEIKRKEIEELERRLQEKAGKVTGIEEQERKLRGAIHKLKAEVATREYNEKLERILQEPFSNLGEEESKRKESDNQEKKLDEQERKLRETFRRLKETHQV